MRRSLEHVEVKVDRGNVVVLRCLCDCTSTTEVTLASFTVIPDRSAQELAFTCDGCHASHRFTIGVSTGGERRG